MMFIFCVDNETQGGSKSGGESSDSGSTEIQFETDSPLSIKASSSSDHHHNHGFDQIQQIATTDEAALRTGTSQNQSKAKSPQQKVVKSLSSCFLN